MEETHIFYTYALLDPRKPGPFTYGEFTFDYEPFYIGKGKGPRCYEHLKENGSSHKLNKIRKIQREGLQPIVLKVAENLSESSAFDLESFLISIIGRSDLNKGPLTNLTDGGDGPTGWIPDEVWRNKQRQVNIGRKMSDEARRNNRKAQTGKKMSVEARRRISEYQTGREKSEETKRKLSEAQTGRKRSEESRQRISEATKGEKNPNYGKHLSEITKLKMTATKHRNRLVTLALTEIRNILGIQGNSEAA